MVMCPVLCTRDIQPGIIALKYLKGLLNGERRAPLPRDVLGQCACVDGCMLMGDIPPKLAITKHLP